MKRPHSLRGKPASRASQRGLRSRGKRRRARTALARADRARGRPSVAIVGRSRRRALGDPRSPPARRGGPGRAQRRHHPGRLQPGARQAAARGSGRAVPPADRPAVRSRSGDAATGDLLLSRWVAGEAQERGITVSDSEVEDQLNRSSSAVRGPEGLPAVPQAVAVHRAGRARPRSAAAPERRDPEDGPDRSSRRRHRQRGPELLHGNISAVPAARDPRHPPDPQQGPGEGSRRRRALASRRLARQLEEGRRSKYSTDPTTKSTGGLRQACRQGPVRAGARRARSSRAAERSSSGRSRARAGYYLIEVEKITPGDDARRSPTVDGARSSSSSPAKPAADRPGLPDGLHRQVDVADLLRRRLSSSSAARTSSRRTTCTAEPPAKSRCPRPVASTAPVGPGHAAVFGSRPSGARRRARSQPAAQGAAPGGRPCPAARRSRRAGAPARPPAGRPAPAPPASAAERRSRRRLTAAVGAGPRPQTRSRGSTRSPGGCAASAPGTASRTSARSSPTRSRRPTSSPTPPARGDDAKLVDELGDVLFQVFFLALLLEERGAGDLGDGRRAMRRS